MRKLYSKRHNDTGDLQVLFDAVKGGDLERCQQMLKENKTLKINCRDENRSTLLMTACQSMCEEKTIYSLAAFLIESGVSVMAKDVFGNTAASYAYIRGHMDVTDLLERTYEQIISMAFGI